MVRKCIVVDAKGHLVGRMASYVAKQIQLGHCYAKKLVGEVCSQRQGSECGPIPVQMTERITTQR